MLRILVLEDDDDLRELLELILTVGGKADCLPVASYEELLTHEARALSCDVAILDVNLGPQRPSGIDAQQWLEAHGFKGRTIFLTGHARHHALVERARTVDRATVLEKPVSTEVIEAVVFDEAR